MNKVTLVGIITMVILAGATYLAVGTTKGGMGGDIVNQLAVVGALALAAITIFVVVKYVRQMQNDTATGEMAKENWDGIGEYKNELPLGWAVLFIGVTVWAIWYFLAGYPLNAYSQIGEYNEAVAEHDAEFNAKYVNMDTETKVEMGESVFLVQCAPCHGLSADGIDGKAANLNQRISAASVKYVIENGSNNHLLGTEMPMPDRNGLFNANTGALITDAEINTVAAYVANGMKGPGDDIFQGTCAACHGADGKGTPYVAPDIASFTPELIVNVLNHGKKGVIGIMPAFTNLTEIQKEALGAYVTSLSK